MGNGSPSEDEIKRQNECIKKCADDNLKIQNKYVQLFNEKKISAEQAAVLLNLAERTHDECTARCVPRRRRFTDDQKEELFDSVTVVGIGASVSIIAGTGVALFATGPLGIAVAGIIFGVAAGLAVTAFKGFDLAIDPIDPKFSKAPVPSFPNVAAIRPVKNTGLNASVARAANAVTANQSEAIGLLNALLTALDRADGASRAGDTSAEAQQLNAAREFAKKLVDVLKKAASLRLALASKWTGRDLDFTISTQDAVTLRDDIIINGFPAPFLKALKKLGIDRVDQDLLLQRLSLTLVNLPSGEQIRFRDLLIDPQLRSGEAGLISVLQQFSLFQ